MKPIYIDTEFMCHTTNPDGTFREVVFSERYYKQYDVLYLCTRSSGQPLYHDLSLLVGSYVEVA